MMRLDGRLPEGYVVLCTGNGDCHSFLVHRLGPSVECPECGRTALSSELLDAYCKHATDGAALAPPKR